MIEIEARKEAASRAARLDAVFAALADPTRRAIIERLSRSEARVTEIAEPFPMSLNAVSKHIRVLEASGVVERHRKGRDHIFSINTRSLDEVDGWIERTRRYWEKRLDAMERVLRELEKEQARGQRIASMDRGDTTGAIVRIRRRVKAGGGADLRLVDQTRFDGSVDQPLSGRGRLPGEAATSDLAAPSAWSCHRRNYAAKCPAPTCRSTGRASSCSRGWAR